MLNRFCRSLLSIGFAVCLFAVDALAAGTQGRLPLSGGSELGWPKEWRTELLVLPSLSSHWGSVFVSPTQAVQVMVNHARPERMVTLTGAKRYWSEFIQAEAKAGRPTASSECKRLSPVMVECQRSGLGKALAPSNPQRPVHYTDRLIWLGQENLVIVRAETPDTAALAKEVASKASLHTSEASR